jgi:hypothetical protein
MHISTFFAPFWGKNESFFIKNRLILEKSGFGINKKMSPPGGSFFKVFERFNYSLTLSTYSPVLVLIRINSPSFTNKGTFTVAPVSTVAGFRVRVAVSPFTPGSL